MALKFVCSRCKNELEINVKARENVFDDQFVDVSPCWKCTENGKKMFNKLADFVDKERKANDTTCTD